MHSRVLLKRAWFDAARFLKDNLLFEILIALAGAIVGYATGGANSHIVNTLIYAVAAWLIVVVVVFFFNLSLSPGRIHFEQSREIISLKEQLKPALEIEFQEDEDRFYYDSPWSFELSDLFDSSRGFRANSYWRLCRLAVKNSSKSGSVENVEVKLTAVDPLPKELAGKLPLPLHFMNDNVQPYKQSKDINPNTTEFVDVVQWRLDRGSMIARF
jgi:hypothetical protein